MFRSSVLRASRLASAPNTSAALLARSAPAAIQSRSASYAVSNVTLADIEKRWESMPPAEQAEVWMQLRDRMKGSWSDLTVQEKKASYWIAFGPHGPRAVPPPGEGTKVFVYTLVGMGVSFALFYAVRLAARPPPSTMSKEWQEASEEYGRQQKLEPISGYTAVQSK